MLLQSKEIDIYYHKEATTLSGNWQILSPNNSGHTYTPRNIYIWRFFLQIIANELSNFPLVVIYGWSVMKNNHHFLY
jgi:hypothetical protein